MSPDGKMIAWGRHPGHVHLIDARTGDSLFIGMVFGEWPAFSPDSQLLAVSRWGEVDLLSVKTGKPIRSLQAASHTFPRASAIDITP